MRDDLSHQSVQKQKSGGTSIFGLAYPVGKNDKTSSADTELKKMQLVLDAIDSIVMLADTTHDNNVVYMNKQAKDAFASLRDRIFTVPTSPTQWATRLTSPIAIRI